MNVLDIRPSCKACCSAELLGYSRLHTPDLLPAEAAQLLPDRATLATVWRYLAGTCGVLEETPMCLCRKIVRWSGQPLSLGKLLACLDISADVGLLQAEKMHKYLSIRLTPGPGKTDLNDSPTLQRLTQAKES
jgi:hypothetical protein